MWTQKRESPLYIVIDYTLSHIQKVSTPLNNCSTIPSRNNNIIKQALLLI